MKGVCFDAFPLPDLTGAAAAEIAVLAEELDALRASVLSASPVRTMTGLYNDRARIGQGDALTEVEREAQESARIGLIDHLHQRLDQQVSRAYGWPDDLTDAQIVDRLIGLNHAPRRTGGGGRGRLCSAGLSGGQGPTIQSDQARTTDAADLSRKGLAARRTRRPGVQPLGHSAKGGGAHVAG